MLPHMPLKGEIQAEQASFPWCPHARFVVGDV